MRLDEKIALEKEEALAKGIELGRKEAEREAEEKTEKATKAAEKKAKESMIKVAKALKAKDFPIEEIITLTDLTPEEIEKL